MSSTLHYIALASLLSNPQPEGHAGSGAGADGPALHAAPQTATPGSDRDATSEPTVPGSARKAATDTATPCSDQRPTPAVVLDSSDRHAAAEAVAAGSSAAATGLERLVVLGKPGLWAITGALERHPDPVARGRLLESLGAFSNALEEQAVWVLRRHLASPSAEERRGAIEGLRRLGPSALGPMLLKNLREPSPEVRVALAAALASAGLKVIPRLVARMEDPEPSVREVVFRALARLLEGDAQTELVGLALLDPAEPVRRAAIELAAMTRHPAHAEALALLAHQGSATEAPLAAEALFHLPKARARLAQLLGDEEAPLEAARVAFTRLRASRLHALDLILPPLLELSGARREALAAPLLEDPTDEEIRDLVQLVDHPDPIRGRCARRWLHAIGPRADEIAATTVPEARPARAAALRAYLADRPAGGITERLLEQARAGPLGQRVRAIRAIAALGQKASRLQLLDLLEDPAPTVRAAAATGVRDLDAAGERLRTLTLDPDPRVRAAAVTALTGQHDWKAWDARLAALRDEAERVRIAAIRTFAGTRHPQALERLEHNILFGTHAERVAAVEAVAESRTLRAAVTLVETVAHRNPEIRRAALDYLDRL